MLHNTGPYGPNETPANMGAPKLPELASPMDIAPNFDHFMKMQQQMHQQTPHPASGHFNLQNYVGYAGTSTSNHPQMSMFRNFNYSHSDSHSKFVAQAQEANLANHFLHPMLHNGNILEDILRNNDDSQKAVDFSNLANNLVNNFKARDRPFIANQTMNIEQMSHFISQTNSHRYFDNNTTKQNEEDISEKRLDEDSNVSKHDNVSSQINATECASNDESSNCSNESTKDKSESNENILLSYLKKTEPKPNQTTYKQDDSDDESTSEKDKEDELKRVISKTNDCKKEDSDSNSDDGKPLNLIQSIKQEPIEHTDTVEPRAETIVVKIEPISTWTDTEHMQPFLRDVNGVSREDSSLSNIVDSVHSVDEATEIVRNGEDTEMSFECPNCYLLFEHPKRFLIHVKWHSFGLINEKRIEEANEKLAFRQQKKELKKEEDMVKKEQAKIKAREIAKIKPPLEIFDCKDCDKKFNTKSKLRNHRHKFHPSREHECKICHVKVMGWFGLQTHMATTHNKTNNFFCDVCDKGFKHAHSLNKHRDTHREKTHGCAECPKMFGSETLLKIHMRSHERAQRGRTFRCSYCGKGFYEAYTLQYHERTHRNERPFKCDICETSYGTNSSLKRHLKVSHSNNEKKPFECETCRRCFSTELIRDRHAARYHGAPTALTYACTECTCRYLRHKDLKRHMYRIHPKGKNRRKYSDSE